MAFAGFPDFYKSPRITTWLNPHLSNVAWAIMEKAYLTASNNPAGDCPSGNVCGATPDSGPYRQTA